MNNYLLNTLNNKDINNISKTSILFECINNIPDYIGSKSEVIQVKHNKTIALKGNSIEHIYISLTGKMEVNNEFENGFIYNFAEIDSIAFIGAMEVMANEKTYSSTLKTTTSCTMIKLEKDDFINWIKSDHELALEVLKFVSTSMYKQSIKKGEVLAYPAIYSLVSYFISIYESEDKDTLIIKKTREEIGSVLGFSVRTINRNLKELKEQDLITVNRKTLSISEHQYNELCNKLNSIK